MNWLGLDIGGANIKSADGKGYAHSVAFPLWKQPRQLVSALREELQVAPSADAIAVTMTGELADCYASKAEGVSAICEAVQQAAAGREVRVYLCDGRFVELQTAREHSLLAAASNWHVLASFTKRFLDGEAGLLIDIGSTTCDIIPIDRSGPVANGLSDPERLTRGELVYTGVERSPLCALLSQVRWRGELCSVAQELFATTADVYLMTGQLAEDPENTDTADGRSRTETFAIGRLARMICADTSMFTREDAIHMVETAHQSQLAMLTSAGQKVVSQMASIPQTIIVSGQGEFLALELAGQLSREATVISLSANLGSKVSSVACAHALACLAREQE